MKKTLGFVVATATTFMLVGCGDSYNSNLEELKVDTLGSLKREVSYLTDSVNGMSLYTFDNDALNITKCDAACQKIWPIFTGGTTESEDIEVFDTNTNHLAYRKHPMYFFANDKVSGDVNGDNVNGIWHLIYAPANTNDSQTKFSSAEESMTQTYLTDGEGRALYTFDNDTNEVSNCYGTCEDTWPVYYQENLTGIPKGMNASDFTTITRDEEKAKAGILKQTAYKGKPLYYFTPDNKKSGETKGDWVNGIWHLVEISAEKTSKIVSSPYTEEAAAEGKKIFTDPTKCAGCHGADGQKPPNGINNIIAKYGDAELIDKKLKDMRDNGNPNNRSSIMVGIASNLSDEAIINLSAFIATLKK